MPTADRHYDDDESDSDDAEAAYERQHGDQMSDANDDALDAWARSYDDLNGAPENDGDR